MNKEQSIEKIKSTLSELKELALSIRGKKELKFEEFVSNEGPVLITNGGLEVGLDVFTKDSEGNQTPINDGEFVCEGKKVTVESGKITKMEEVKEEDVMESPEDNANVNVDSEEESLRKDDDLEDELKLEDDSEVEVEAPEKEEEEVSVEDRIKGLEDAVSKILSIMDQMMTKTQETMSQNVELEKKVQELSSQPGDEPVEVKLSKNTQTLSDVELRIERFKNMAKSIE